MLKDKRDVLDIQLSDIGVRLSKLYDALETGKLSLDDLSPRIKELKTRQNDLSKTKVQMEVDAVLQNVQHLDAKKVKAYAQDLNNLLGEADCTRSKTFLRSFVTRITIDNDKAKIEYNLPMPPDGKKMESVGVLPISTLGGEGGSRTPTHCCTGS
jgi:site-specific DNA recombinase